LTFLDGNWKALVKKIFSAPLTFKVGGNQVFTFPAETILQPGCTITVWSGKGADKKENVPYSLFWTKKHMWSDSGDTAVLKDADDNEIDQVEEKPIVYSSEVNIQFFNYR
jgi:hypothetical protein